METASSKYVIAYVIAKQKLASSEQEQVRVCLGRYGGELRDFQGEVLLPGHTGVMMVLNGALLFLPDNTREKVIASGRNPCWAAHAIKLGLESVQAIHAPSIGLYAD